MDFLIHYLCCTKYYVCKLPAVVARWISDFAQDLNWIKRVESSECLDGQTIQLRACRPCITPTSRDFSSDHHHSSNISHIFTRRRPTANFYSTITMADEAPTFALTLDGAAPVAPILDGDPPAEEETVPEEENTAHFEPVVSCYCSWSSSFNASTVSTYIST